MHNFYFSTVYDTTLLGVGQVNIPDEYEDEINDEELQRTLDGVLETRAADDMSSYPERKRALYHAHYISEETYLELCRVVEEENQKLGLPPRS